MIITDKQKDKQRQILTIAHSVYSRGLSKLAFFKVGNKEKSQDLVQDTFLKTWKYIMKGGKIILMKAFLYHILNDLIVDEYRKKKTVSLDVLIKKGLEPGFEESYQLNSFDDKIAVFLISKLPPKYQKIIEMRFVEDLSFEEMSRVLGQSKNTIAVQVHRGLKKLKILYESYEKMNNLKFNFK